MGFGKRMGMKFLLSFALCILTLVTQGATPSSKSFRGTGGILVSSNDTTALITIDGSGVVATGTNSTIRISTNAVLLTAATQANFGLGFTGVVVGSTAHIGLDLSNVVTAPIARLLTNLVWVSKAGSDATGSRCRMDLPFATPSAAKLAALNGDTIVVLPGFHVATNSLAKSNVNWWVMAGATLAYTNTLITNNAGTARSLFDDLDNAMVFKVDGYGDFLYDAGVQAFDASGFLPVPSNTSIKGLMYLQNSNSAVNFKGRTAFVRAYPTSPIQPAAFYISKCSNVTVTVDEIIDLGMGVTVQIGVDEFDDPVLANSLVTGAYWELGEFYLNVGTIRTTWYPIWASQPAGATHAADWWIRAGYVTNIQGTALYLSGVGTSPNWRTWIDVLAVENDAIAAYGLATAGRHYLRAMKLQSRNAVTLSDSTGGSARLWADIQKLSATSKAIDIGGSVARTQYDLTVHEIDDMLGTMNPAVTVNFSGSAWLRGGRTLVTNGVCLNHFGGTLKVEDYEMNSSCSTNSCVMVRTNGLTMKGCTLINTNTMFSISSDVNATNNIRIYGSRGTSPATNKLTTLVGPWTVDTDVQ